MSETQIIQHGNGTNGVAAHIRQATDVAGACREIVTASPSDRRIKQDIAPIELS